MSNVEGQATRRRAVQEIPLTGWERLRLGVFLSFLVLVFVGGGASRADVLSLLYLRPAAILCIVALLLAPARFDFRRVRVPLLLLGALALWMAIQLIPLPPGVWMNLPGHERFAEAAAAAGLPQPWRPISISPDLTLNSLISLAVPTAALVAMATLGTRQAERGVLLFLVLAGVASAVLGIAQMTSGAESPLYLYRVTNEGMPVGFFANRNHQAALLACAFPLLAAWAAPHGNDPRADLARRWLAGVGGALLIPLVVVTGSRSGVLLAVLGLAAALLVFRVSRPSRRVPRDGRATALVVAPWVLGAGLLLVSVWLSRAPAIQRFLQSGLGEEQRVQDLGLFVQLARDFFPVGSGFGSFDPLYRIYEPYGQLRMTYLNHAHNDLMELLITGGIVGGLLLLAFLGWWLARSLRISLAPGQGSSAMLRIAGSGIILILLVASLFDYPLRTPILMTVLAIAAAWLGAGSPSSRGEHNR